MLGAIRLMGVELRLGWKQFFLFGLLCALCFQVVMLLALIVRFQSLPNYVQIYSWLDNVFHIINSTPSLADAAGIVSEEWLIEIGQMNYDYGTGLSIWSLNVVPSRLVVLTIMGAMVALCFKLLKRDHCGSASKGSAVAALSGGSLMVFMTNATMSWVVCCATPSWVVGLAMLGLGVSTSLALESMGPALSTVGFTLLLAACLFLAWKKTHQPEAVAGEPDHA